MLYIQTNGLVAKSINDDSIEWHYAGPEPWARNHAYPLGFWVRAEPDNGNYCKAVVDGTSGAQPPEFLPPISHPIVWQDTGTTASTAGVPVDQVLTPGPLTLPQSHSLYYFNLSSGVVYNSIRSQNFAFQLPAGATTCGTTPPACKAVQTKGSPTIDPLLLLTAYAPPLDAESPYDWKRDFLRVPGFSLGFSLSSPTSNFYLGGSSEFPVRNVQLVYGVIFTKSAILPPAASRAPGTVGGTPNTQQKFRTGYFIGFTCNFANFIQSLF